MILQSLKELALREQLLAIPNYEPKEVAWVITVGEEGEFAGIAPTVSESGEGKRPRVKKIQIPRQSGRTSAATAEFLVDKSEYVFGAEPETSNPRAPVELQERRELFAAKVGEAAKATHSPALAAVRDFLSSEGERAECLTALGPDYKSNDLFAFRYSGSPPDSFVHLEPAVMRYWLELRQGEETGRSQCVVCGRRAQPVDKHPPIRRVPGASTTGVALVSFNERAFWSLGLERNQNAPFCRECADAYTTTLNRCLDDRYPSPVQEGAYLPRRNIRLSHNTAAVYWAEKESNLLDWLAEMLEGSNEEAVAALFGSPYKGRLLECDASRFFALILSGAKGRAILRGTHIGTVEEAARNLRRYFSELDIAPVLPAPLYRLLASLVLLRKRKNLPPNLPPNLAASFFLCAVSGSPFPRWLYSAALQRARAERKDPVPRERAALIKAFLIRNCGKEITVALDKDNMQPGYRLGRLFAVLENLQAQAIPNISATITDRYYGAASTRPATVFTSLVRMAQHHAAKLEGGGIFHQKLLGEILWGVGTFPATLDLEQQGLFALGYYHQRQAPVYQGRAAAGGVGVTV